MSKNISEIDKNFKIADVVRDGFKFYNIDGAPFRIYGVFREGDRYRRMPEAVAKSVSEGVHFLHANTAGGRVRFKTDSSRVTIIAKVDKPGKMPHFAFTGAIGFDIYEKNEDGYNYLYSFIPSCDITDTLEAPAYLGEKKMRDLTIGFPLYTDVCEVLIGIEEDAVLEAGDEYLPGDPVVYYGSSITQGGCASRAGTSYQGHICRRFDRDYINLGFSGNARAEDTMIDYIASLPMSVFVEDYDHNSPSVEHLRSTHEKLFLAVRATHPDIPVIFMSRPSYHLTADEEERRAVVLATYEAALARGDKNVYFLDGSALMKLVKSEGTVDSCHPTDLGFWSMALALGDIFEDIYKNA